MPRFDKKRLLAGVVAVALAPCTLNAGEDFTPEEVQAQYIIKMQPYVALGHPPRDMHTMCYYEKPGVPEEASVGQLIAKFVRHTPVHSKAPPLSVKALHAIRNVTGCDVFFIPASEGGTIDTILTALAASETLTISDAPRFIFHGGMVGFLFDEHNHITMEASVKNMQQKNVQLHPDILELMSRVDQ